MYRVKNLLCARGSKTDWEDVGSFQTDAIFEYFSSYKASKVASLIVKWVLGGINNFVPNKKGKNPKSQLNLLWNMLLPL